MARHAKTGAYLEDYLAKRRSRKTRRVPGQYTTGYSTGGGDLVKVMGWNARRRKKVLRGGGKKSPGKITRYYPVTSKGHYASASRERRRALRAKKFAAAEKASA